MKVVALVSGGKDSYYSIMKCKKFGHEIIALANLSPEEGLDEMDSFMFQTVGHHIINAQADCMELPLFRYSINGSALSQTLEYHQTEEDEVESLYKLLQRVKVDTVIDY
jgi:diphthine-ammonia ligase